MQMLPQESTCSPQLLSFTQHFPVTYDKAYHTLEHYYTWSLYERNLS